MALPIPALSVFRSHYCRELSDTLWKRRMAWIEEQAASLPAGTKVLDVGAGACLYRKAFDHCEYTTQDFCQTPDFGYGTIDVVSDITAIPLPDESFDAILCSEVFEHIPFPIESLTEISRLLKPGGTLIFSSPLGSGHHQKPFHFYGGYTRFWYEKFFPENNLQIDSLTPNGGLYGHAAELLWRTHQTTVGELYPKKGLSRLRAMIMQFFIYNIPTVVLWNFEHKKVIEDFTVCFFCRATKLPTSKKKLKKS